MGQEEGKPRASVMRGTRRARRPVPRPWAAARGRETRQGLQEFPDHPRAAGGGAPLTHRLLTTDWEGQPALGPRPTPYLPRGPRSLGHMTGPCQARASRRPVGMGRPARRRGRKRAVCRPAALGLGALRLCSPGESHRHPRDPASSPGRPGASRACLPTLPQPPGRRKRSRLASRSSFPAHGTAAARGGLRQRVLTTQQARRGAQPGVFGHRTPLKDSGVVGAWAREVDAPFFSQTPAYSP